MEINVYVKVVIGGSIVQRYKTHQGPNHGYRGIPEYTKENEEGKVKQLDVRNKKDEQNTGTCV